MRQALRIVHAAVALGALVAARPARASNYALEEIPQVIPPAAAQTLKTAGIGTTFQLLERGAAPRARRTLANSTHIAEKTLAGWIQMADVMRVKGIGPDVTRLLAACGVRTVSELKNQDPSRLYGEIMKVNSKLHLSDNPPSVEHLQAWIAQAKALPIVLH